MKQLFVSYSRVNKDDVDDLVRRLPGLGYQPWVDASLHGGQTWWEEILRRIAECDAFIAVVSRDSLNSVACQRELEWALTLGKPVLPVAVEHVMQALPSEISKRQIVDYSEPGQDAAYALFGALTALPPAPPPPEGLPEPPAAPLSYLTDLVDRVAKDEPLTHEEQRQIINQLQPALRSADAEERQGAQFILDRFSRRDDLYADIYRILAQVTAPEGQSRDTPSPSTPHETVPAQGSAPPDSTTAPPQPYSGFASQPLPIYPATRSRRVGLILALVAVIVVASGGVGAWLLLRDHGGGKPTAAGTIEGKPIPVGKEPYDLAKGDGFLWTANTGETTISKIDPAVGTAQQIEVGGSPYELAATPGSVWVLNYSDAITRVNTATGEVSKPIAAGRVDIADIAAGGGYVWLSHTDNTVTRIDANTSQPAGNPIPVGKAPMSMAFGDNFLYVVNTGDSTISAIDTTGTVRGEPLQVEDAVGGIEIVGGTIYVGTKDSVTPIDENSFAVGKQISLKGGSYFTPDGKGIWVAFPVTNELRYFDHTGAESKGGPITSIGKGTADMMLIDHTLWVVDQERNSLVRVKVR